MKLNWGIISAGLISQDFCSAIKLLDQNNHHIAGVSARKLEDAKSFAERFNIPKYYDNYEEMCKSPDINIVYVGTVNSKHKEMCLLAIQNGKHVLCEKPMTVDGNEQEEVLNAAKSKNVFFMEALWSRFFPAMDKLREELNNKTIGDVKALQANFFVKINHKERITAKELGGGTLLDIGIYPLQFALMVFNHEEPIEIKASGHLFPSGVDESISITLKFSNNRIANILASSSSGKLGSGIIAGENGVIQIPRFLWCPTEIILANGEKLEFPVPKCETNFDNSGGLSYQAEAIRIAIGEGKIEHPYVKHDHSRLIMKIMDEARRQIGSTYK